MVPDNSNNILEIKNITVSYGAIIALKKVFLEVKQGQVVILIGSNGAGKSTLLNTIIGLEKPDEGRIIYHTDDITFWLPERVTRSGIFLIPEDGGIFRTLTVKENLQLGAYYSFEKYSEQLEFVVNLFPLLKERLKQTAGTLSGGEQRILAFSKALMANSKILMFDEPSLGLSPKYIIQIYDTIKYLNRYGYTILLAEQNSVQAFKYADKIYVLDDGQITLDGSPADLKDYKRIKEVYLGR